jgi:SpoVK/Ycf46/Vps4 family AAA+-type ATPase
MTLATQAWETLCMVDIHEAAVQFSKMIKAALNENAREREVEVKQRRSGTPSEQLVNLQRARDRARKKGQNQCTSMCRKETMLAAVEKLKKDPNHAWRCLTDVAGKKGSGMVQLMEDKGPLSIHDTAFELNYHFLGKVHKLKADMNSFVDDKALEGARKKAARLDLVLSSFEISEVTTAKVRKAIKKAKKSSALDLDGLTPDILKMCGEPIIEPLTYIINELIRTSTVPEIWKHDRVVPVRKKRSQSDKKNYRSVSIL